MGSNFCRPTRLNECCFHRVLTVVKNGFVFNEGYAVQIESTNFLWQKITDIAIKTQGHKEHESFGFFMHDESNQIKGGCNGFIFYGCLYVDQLWTDDSLRGNGHGTHLMQLAENLAKDKNCLFMAVNTMHWEALDFYKKLGFYVEFERHGFEKKRGFLFFKEKFIKKET